MTLRRSLSLLYASSLLSLGACNSSRPASPTADGADWLMHGRTSGEQRFSPLAHNALPPLSRLAHCR
jgi:hypothetical protein